MLYQNNNSTYTLETNDNLQTIRPFSDPSFPFIITHLNMSQLPIPYIPWHWHDEFEFVWVKSGTLVLNTSQASYVLHEEEGAFLNYGILHMLKTEPGKDCDFFIARFAERLLFPDSGTTVTENYLRPILLSQKLRCLHLTTENSTTTEMLHFMRQIIDIYYRDLPGKHLLLLSRFYSFWEALYTYQYSQELVSTRISIADFNRVSVAIHFIAQNYMNPLTLEDIADSIHLSKSECCRCFKRALSLSPVEFLIHYRVMESIRKMQTKEAATHSISVLAASVGFNSVSYYNKQFKRITGYTPLEYRNTTLSHIKDSIWEKEFMEIINSSVSHN